MVGGYTEKEKNKFLTNLVALKEYFIHNNIVNMATGFRPKSERIIELAGYSSEELMLLAIEASKHLGWQAGNIKSEEAEFYTSASLRSWQEKVVLSVIDGKDGQLLATSVCTSMQLFDWGKNKQNFDKLIAAMQQVQNSHNMPSNVSKAVDNTACAYTLSHRLEWKFSSSNQQADSTAIHWSPVE